MMNRLLFPLLILALTSNGAAQIGTTPGPLPIGVTPAVADPSQLEMLLNDRRPPMTFKTDDVLTVQVRAVEHYAEKVIVADDGTIQFSLIGKVLVAGKTVQELQTAIGDLLRSGGFVREPQVTVIIDSSPSSVVAVFGSVNKPGVFPAAGELTLADYISLAAGFVETTPGSTTTSSPADINVTLIRASLSGPVRIPLGTDLRDSKWGRIPLYAGDQIRVDKVGLVYAVGAFRVQGGYQLKNTRPTTVSQLIGLAGGIGYEADTKDSHIVRYTSGVPAVLHIDVKKILRGTAPDVALESDDILFVPTNNLKAAIKGGGTGLVVNLASSYLYRQ